MDPMVKFDHFLLPELTDTEQMMISFYHPFMRVARLSGGGVGYEYLFANNILFEY